MSLKLSICVPTYNRAAWLRFNLPLWAEQVALFPDECELVVSDNASPDDTAQAVEEARAFGPIRYHRNAENIGGNPNFFKAANELARGEFVWVVGDDDTPTEGIVERVLIVLRAHPELDFVSINYATWLPSGPPTHRMKASELPIHLEAVNPDVSDRYLPQLKDNMNNAMYRFTSIYSWVMRREMSAQAFEGSLHEAPFTTLRSVVSHSMYIADHCLDKPAFYLGRPGIITSADVSWPRFMPLYLLHWQPELFDYFEARGASRAVMDKHRREALTLIPPTLARMLVERDLPLRHLFSLSAYMKYNRRFKEFTPAMLRTLARCIHMRAPKPLARVAMRTWRRFRPAVVTPAQANGADVS